MANSNNNPQSVIPDVEYNVGGNFIPVPPPGGADAGKVLGAISAGTVGWVEDQGAGVIQQQSDWTETDDTKVTFVRHKPANLVQDAAYVHTDNNFTDADSAKLAGIAAGAEVNVQSDWNESDSSSDAFIANKPTQKPVVAGANISIVDGQDSVTISATVPTVDQTYSSSSTNAQSGTAVAGALASVNQVPASTSSDANKVLTVDSQGVPGWASAGGGGDQPLPAVGEKTLRFQFEDATYDPSTNLAVTGGTWTVVSASKGIWDFNYPQASWDNLFQNKITSSAQACRVVDSNMTGVTSVNSLFMACYQLKGLDLKSTVSIRSTQQLADGCSALTTASFGSTYGNGVSAVRMFQGCNILKEFKCNCDGTNSFNASNGNCMFWGCSQLRTLDFNIRLRGGASDISGMFFGCYSLRSVYIEGISNNVNATNTFNGCYQMQIAPFMDRVNISNASSMFKDCKSLIETPNICNCFHGCTNFSDAFNGCNSLRRINYIDTATATNVSGMFKYCTNVESGADTLYQQMSTQSTPPSSYSGCFTNCGSSTPSGTAALAQIPSAWGGGAA